MTLDALGRAALASSAFPELINSLIFRVAVLTDVRIGKFLARRSASVFTLRSEDLIFGNLYTSCLISRLPVIF